MSKSIWVRTRPCSTTRRNERPIPSSWVGTPLLPGIHPSFAASGDRSSSLAAKHPESYHRRSATKRLAAVNKLVFDVIPEDPTHPEYRLGATLGDQYKHWFRAKFFQQYRLFFRYHAASRVIIFCWFNDDSTLRASESDDDAYRTFERMIGRVNPPDDWDRLLALSAVSSRERKG